MLRVGRGRGTIPIWRFNVTALADLAFWKELRTGIREFFAINSDSVDSHATVWETFKVSVRDKCMSKMGGIRKVSEGKV